jgi:hypothetical protein
MTDAEPKQPADPPRTTGAVPSKKLDLDRLPSSVLRTTEAA